MADLTPTHDFPGLRISNLNSRSAPSADYVCGGCGADGQATGDKDVKALVDHYTDNHGPAHRNGGRR
ncbi:hypothetical protein [Streptomyces sp. NBC_01465]|uniref:hypothetical protein n=1 Tax=Streptomyces sp. NBC_01465 TaxID=2903878 RepID=UPI002E2F3545|nr:hypothetical protein [Streptomyces sp. NBC_01465]